MLFILVLLCDYDCDAHANSTDFEYSPMRSIQLLFMWFKTMYNFERLCERFVVVFLKKFFFAKPVAPRFPDEQFQSSGSLWGGIPTKRHNIAACCAPSKYRRLLELKVAHHWPWFRRKPLFVSLFRFVCLFIVGFFSLLCFWNCCFHVFEISNETMDGPIDCMYALDVLWVAYDWLGVRKSSTQPIWTCQLASESTSNSIECIIQIILRAKTT